MFHVKDVFGEERFGHRAALLRLSVGIEPYEQLDRTISSAMDAL